MPNYTIPPWLTPAAAQGYGELAQNAARIGMENDMQKARLSQQAQQFAVETQQRAQEIAAENAAKAEQLNYEHQLEQQKMQVEQAYKQQQLALDQQDNDLASKKFDATTKEAADRFLATQKFQKATLPKEQGGEGLTTMQAALKYISPYMTGTEIGRLSTVPPDFKPGNTFAIPGAASESLVQVAPQRWEKYATIPQTVTNVPAALPVSNAEGKVIGNVIQIPGQKPHYQSVTEKTDDLNELIRKRQEAKTGTKTSTAVDKATPERKAVGGYKIGVVYRGGLRYLGGDPNDEKSWEKVQSQ